MTLKQLLNWLNSILHPKPTPTPVPTPEPVPTPIPVPNPTPIPPSGSVGRPVGNGMLIGGEKNNFLSDTQLQHPKIFFYIPRMRWTYLEASQGRKDFSLLQTQIDRYHKFNKEYLIPVMTGPDCNPSWLSSEPPWSTKLLDAYLDLHRQLEQATRSSTRCGVWVTGPTLSSQEMHYQDNSGNLNQFPDYSPQKMIDAWKYVSKGMHEIYTDCIKIYSLSFQTNAYKPYVQPVVEYLTKTFPKEHLAFQFNSLQETTSRTYIKPQLDLHNQGYWTGAEKVQPGHNVGFNDFPELNYIANYSGDEKYL